MKQYDHYATSAVIYSIDGQRADIRIGSSSTLLHHIEIIGDPTLLTVGEEAPIRWTERAGSFSPVPQVMASGNSAGEVLLNQYPDDLVLENTDHGLTIKDHSIQKSHLAFDLGNIVVGGGGIEQPGQDTVSAHHILSVTHSDSVAGAVLQGDLIIGNATPKWDRLSWSKPTAGSINFLGGYNADNNPSWQTASYNPGASAKILQSDTAGALNLDHLNIGTATGTISGELHVSGKVGIGCFTPTAKTDILSTTEQLRLDYDDTHYASFTVGSGGNLTIAPTGDFVFDPTGDDILPNLNYDLNIGSLQKKYLTLFAAELWVETLVAQNTIATIGGRILVGPTTVLTSDLAPADTTIYVKHNEMAAGVPDHSWGDIVYLEADGKVEFIRILNGPFGSGPYSYTVTRDLDGTGANQWYAGDAVFNTGDVYDGVGDGFIDIYSYRGVKSATQYGPTVVGNVRNSGDPTHFNDWTEHWAIGNLNGIYGYGSTAYGVAVGKYSDTTSYLTADATNGIRIMRGAVQLGQWDIYGNILIGQSVASQNNIYITSGIISIRNNTTERIGLTAAGILTIKDSGGNAVFTFDASLGAEFTKPLTLATTGGIYQGTGTFASPTTGMKLWNDGGYGRLAGYNTGVLQAYIGTDGKLYAGAGATYLDADGLTIGVGINNPNKIKFNASAPVYTPAYIYTYLSGATPNRGAITTIEVNKESAGSIDSIVYLVADTNYLAVTSTFIYTAAGSDLCVGRALYVGSILYSPNDNDIWLDNDIRAAGGIIAGSISIDPAVGTINTDHVDTLTGNLADAYAGAFGSQPGYTGAYTVTRHNYINLVNPSLAGSAVLTDACIFRFNAAAGTHKAVDSGGTKTTPGAVNAWLKVNINGVVFYLPAYTSKTS
jgi:hypothetical protein